MAATPRLAGHNGAVYVDTAGGTTFVKCLDVKEWSFDSGVEMLDVSIKGDAEVRWQTSHGTGTKFTAKRDHEGVSVFVAFLASSISNHQKPNWRLDLIDNDGGYTQFTGLGFAKTASATAPSDAAEETIEIQFDDVWTYT